MSWETFRYREIKKLPDNKVAVTVLIMDLDVEYFRNMVCETLGEGCSVVLKSNDLYFEEHELTMSDSEFVKLRLLGLTPSFSTSFIKSSELNN